MTDPDTPRLHVSVNLGLCVSSGNCAMSAPAVFGQEADDGVVRLLDPHPGRQLQDSVELAEDLCPVRAIHLARS